jgi:hypothetical protein
LLSAFAVVAACDPASTVGYGPAGEDDASVSDGSDEAAVVVADAGPAFRYNADASVPRDGSASPPLCPDGGHTTISGTVFAPNATLPLYNVIVFAPSGPLEPLGHGASCEPCGALNSAKAFATTLSDAMGHFVLVDPPTGKNVAMVVQVGKWRRSVVVPEVVPCTDNALGDPDLTRLPRNTTEGDMPMIAVTTGGADAIACMLPKLGIDASEFGVSGATAITLYEGGGGQGPAGIQSAETLWNDVATMKTYDMLILSCEGTESVGDLDGGDSLLSTLGTKDSRSFAAMTKYLDAGGRIFGTDYMYTWWKDSPDPNLAAAATIPGGAPSGGSEVLLDTSFPKGKALADWLSFQYPMQAYATIDLDVVFDNVSAANAATTQVWGRGTDVSTGDPTGHPRFMTVNTPVGNPAASQCGKAVHLDAHVNEDDDVNASYPAGCISPFSAAEKAFAFFFFDLAACIQVDGDAPKPPPPTASLPQ